MSDDLLQGFMLVTGAIGFLLISRPPHIARWGWLIGFAGQPFWLWSTHQAGQWGMFMLAIVYFFGYAKGTWQVWGVRVRGRA